tara:strand:+ start:22 stop:402 length:381 start_codon:yes stop_codon:yes gene_type:complete
MYTGRQEDWNIHDKSYGSNHSTSPGGSYQEKSYNSDNASPGSEYNKKQDEEQKQEEKHEEENIDTMVEENQPPQEEEAADPVKSPNLFIPPPEQQDTPTKKKNIKNIEEAITKAIKEEKETIILDK